MESQLEDDLDTEVETMRRMYKEKLTGCRETTLRYKGENGIMKKKGMYLYAEVYTYAYIYIYKTICLGPDHIDIYI
jgi:hypothetical protein